MKRVQGLSKIKTNQVELIIKDLEEARRASLNLIEDLTDEIEKRKAAERDLIISRQRMMLHFEQTPLAIIDFDPNGNIIEWNTSASLIFGYTHEEVIGKFMTLIVPENVWEYIDGVWESLITQKGGTRSSNENITKDGRIINCEWFNTPLVDPSGIIIGVSSLILDITEQKKAEADLKKTQLILKATLNSPVEMIILAIDMDYNYLSFNDVHKAVMRSAYGITVEAGMNLLECMIGEDDILNAKENYGRAMKGESFITIQEYGDKVRSYYESFYNPIRNEKEEIVGATAFARDITKRIESELALKVSEEKFRNLFEHSPVGKSITSVDGSINVNGAFCNVLGYTEDELKSKNWKEISHPEDNKMTDEIVQSLLKGEIGNARFEKRYIHKNGSTVFTDVSTYLQRDNDGKPQYFITSIIDITDRKNAESQIIRLNESLEQRVIERTAQLEAANKELEAFSYSVSHDLRAPLRAIHGFTRILREDCKDLLDEEGKRICGIIEASSVHMGQLIDDLLSFSRIGRTEINCSGIDMTKMANTVYNELLTTEEKKRIKFTVRKLPVAIGDFATIRQVMINLISNAIKYSAKMETPEIEVGCEKNNSTPVYYVKDNGVGFDMQYVKKLFGVFQRLHSSKEFEGNGVGLAIVQRIIHRHGGEVWAEAEVGKGATFYFTLPVVGNLKKESDIITKSMV